MSPDPEPPARLTGQEPDSPAADPVPQRRRAPQAAGPGPLDGAALLRLVLMAASGVGVVAALALWATGHGTAALRVLAGDVLALVILLLLAR